VTEEGHAGGRGSIQLSAASRIFHGVEAAHNSFISLPPLFEVDKKANYNTRMIRCHGLRRLGSFTAI